jgi:hypothetical protein
MPVIPTLGRVRQENHWSETSLGCIERTCHQNKRNRRKKKEKKKKKGQLHSDTYFKGSAEILGQREDVAPKRESC